jgi:hypothetical protein
LRKSSFWSGVRGMLGLLCPVNNPEPPAWYALGTAAVRLPPGIGGKVSDYMVELNRIELSAS